MKFEEVYPFMKVVIRDWDEMVEEFGVRPTGTIDCKYGFNDHVMKDTCGKIATVVGIHAPDAFCLFVDGNDCPEEDSYAPETFRPFTWLDMVAPPKEEKKEGSHLRLIN
jgi:hypothetical protein